jgi:hypothetical protein
MNRLAIQQCRTHIILVCFLHRFLRRNLGLALLFERQSSIVVADGPQESRIVRLQLDAAEWAAAPLPEPLEQALLVEEVLAGQLQDLLALHEGVSTHGAIAPNRRGCERPALFAQPLHEALRGRVDARRCLRRQELRGR